MAKAKPLILVRVEPEFTLSDGRPRPCIRCGHKHRRMIRWKRKDYCSPYCIKRSGYKGRVVVSV